MGRKSPEFVGRTLYHYGTIRRGKINMKLIQMIPLHLVKESILRLAIRFPQFTLVESDGYLKIYEQVR